MKTTEHGIEDSKDGRERLPHAADGAAERAGAGQGIQERGAGAGARPAAGGREREDGQLSRRVRQALERALQEGVGSAAARQRERNDRLENRVEALEKGHEAHEKGHDELGKEVRSRVAAVEGEVAALRRDGPPPGGSGRLGGRCVGHGQKTPAEAQVAA